MRRYERVGCDVILWLSADVVCTSDLYEESGWTDIY